MYPSIPSVATEIEEPICTVDMEEAGVRYLYIPITDILFWEHQGYSRAHTVDNCTDQGGLALCCMYHKSTWGAWCQIDAG